eukprot:GHVQ01005887.1.p1 GENE.GHVQ01005887.1~~GHVQ01005887.1.p1  ORF type:complete len:735 (+),score=57.11 GHVQ01005887.1:49-2205(+)
MTITASILFVAAATATARRDLPNTLSVQTVRPLQFQSTTSSYLQRGQLLNNIPPIYGLTENGGEVDHVPNTVTFGDNISLGDDYGLNAFHDEAVDGGGNINNAQSPIASTTSSATVNTEGKSSKRETDGVTKQEGFLQTRNAARYSVGNWFGNTWKNILTGRTKLDKVFYNMAFIIIRSVHRCEFYLKYQLSEKVDDYLNRFQDMLRSSGAYKKLNVEERFGENVFYGSKAIACILGCILRLKYYNKSLAKLGTQPAMLKMIQIAFLNRVNLNAQDINVENLGLAERVQRLTTMSNILIAVAVSIASHMGDWSTPKPLTLIEQKQPPATYIDASCVLKPLASAGISPPFVSELRKRYGYTPAVTTVTHVIIDSVVIGLSMLLALPGWDVRSGVRNIVHQCWLKDLNIVQVTVEGVARFFPVTKVTKKDVSLVRMPTTPARLPDSGYTVEDSGYTVRTLVTPWNWGKGLEIPSYKDIEKQYAVDDVQTFLNYAEQHCIGHAQSYILRVFMDNSMKDLPADSERIVRCASCLFRAFHKLKTEDPVLSDSIIRNTLLKDAREKAAVVGHDKFMIIMTDDIFDPDRRQHILQYKILETGMVPIALGMAEAEPSGPVEVNYRRSDSGERSVQADFVKTIASQMRDTILPDIVKVVWVHSFDGIKEMMYLQLLTRVAQLALALALLTRDKFWEGEQSVGQSWTDEELFTLAHATVVAAWKKEEE